MSNARTGSGHKNKAATRGLRPRMTLIEPPLRAAFSLRVDGRPSGTGKLARNVSLTVQTQSEISDTGEDIRRGFSEPPCPHRRAPRNRLLPCAAGKLCVGV